MGRFFLFAGFLTVAIGIAIHANLNLPYLLSWLGHLPGDIFIKKENITLYFPITSSLLLSALGAFLLYLIAGSSKKN